MTRTRHSTQIWTGRAVLKQEVGMVSWCQGVFLSCLARKMSIRSSDITHFLWRI